MSWPITASFAITLLKAEDIASCWLTKPCHVQAVRESRARAKSDWRRISPTSTPEPKGRGDSSSPTHYRDTEKQHFEILDEPTSVVWSSGESNAFEHDLKEDLGVKGKGRRVEGDLLNCRVNVIGSGNRVGRQQFNNFGRREVATICHTGEDHIEWVLGFWDQPIWGRGSCIRAAELEFQLRSPGAVGNTDCCGKLNQIPRSDLVP